MKYRFAVAVDTPLLAMWNHQLIRDEGHRNPMTPAELEARMRGRLDTGEYHALIFNDGNEDVAYALFRETKEEIYLRQFFVARSRRREGIGRHAIQFLFNHWPHNKRWSVSVLVNNQPALAFWHAMGYTDYVLNLEITPDKRPTDEKTRRPGD